MKPTEAGRAFEREVAVVLNADLVPGSGNQWHAKLDLEDSGKLLLSLKWTGADRFIIGANLLDEVTRAIVAPGGVGGEYAGGLVVGIGGKAFVVFELGDFAKMLQEKITISSQTKAEARRERAATPILMREDK